MAYLGEKIPKLGFGLMRLPLREKEIDIEELSRMTDMFLERGFTYFDTAPGYYEGRSEEAIRKALIDRHPRDSFQFATKLPAWAVGSAAEVRDMFYRSLERTGAGYFDYFLLHNLGGARTAFFDKYGAWELVEEMKREGLIRHAGFSMHDKAVALDEVLKAHPEMEFVQLQINYVDWENESVQSRKCYETARRHEKPVIVMEPVMGGMLANLPESAAVILRQAGVPQAELALRFALSLDGLVTVLSGMSSLQQMDENTTLMRNLKSLTETDYALIERVQAALDAMPSVPCTGCQYCVKGCPQKINIPGVMESLNTVRIYNQMTAAKGHYIIFCTRRGGRAGECIDCGHCTEVCPQHLPIPALMKEASELFDS